MKREGLVEDVRYFGQPRRYPEIIDELKTDLVVAGHQPDFRLISDPGPGSIHDGHMVTRRDYPDLSPPASFVDCWTCYVTWEIGK